MNKNISRTYDKDTRYMPVFICNPDMLDVPIYSHTLGKKNDEMKNDVYIPLAKILVPHSGICQTTDYLWSKNVFCCHYKMQIKFISPYFLKKNAKIEASATIFFVRVSNLSTGGRNH